MTYLKLSKWSGQFTPPIILRIRRKIAGNLAGGESVLVLDANAVGLTDEVKRAIQLGWPADKVRFSNAHPSAAPLSGAKSSSRSNPTARKSQTDQEPKEQLPRSE